MLFDVPVIAPARGLDPAWLDYNGHLNMAYYNVLFDKAVDHAFDLIGCGPGYLAARSMSFFTAETHVCYVRELKPDAMVTVSVQILDFDAKRLHLFEEMRPRSPRWRRPTKACRAPSAPDGQSASSARNRTGLPD